MNLNSRRRRTDSYLVWKKSRLSEQAKGGLQECPVM